MNKQEEIKFKDRTRNGFKYVIHTKRGNNIQYPIVGEVLIGNSWNVKQWTSEGNYYNTGNKSFYDLIPIKEFKEFKELEKRRK